MHRERALVLIIAYKFTKGALWLVFAAVLLVTMRLGIADRMVWFADQLRHHSGAWSLRLADLIVRAATRRGLWTITVALVADGTVTLFEGWALVHGRWWGPWIVVAATGALVPFEIVALVRHPHAVRFAVLLLNAAIVVYLARKATRERRVTRLDRPAERSG